jgi:vacuolar-type H+-ATPase subunit C/Vma6
MNGKTLPPLPGFEDSDRDLLEYLHTRLRCRSQRFIPDAQYARLMEMDTNQIAHYLSEAGYGEHARTLGLTLAGADLIRAIVERYLAQELAQLRKICVCSRLALTWLRAYAWKYDLLQLRFVLRSRDAGMAAQSHVVLAALANISPETYRRLLRTEEFDVGAPEFSELLASPFAETLRRYYGTAARDAETLEFSLLEDYYHGVIGRMLNSIPEDDPARPLLLAEVHYANLSTLLSGRLAEVEPEQLQARFVVLGFWENEEAVREALSEAKLADVLRGLRSLDRIGFFQAFTEPGATAETAGDVERLARRTMLRFIRKAIGHSRPSPASLIGYLAWIEIEGRNLMALAMGKQAGLPQETIASLLVTDERTLVKA